MILSDPSIMFATEHVAPACFTECHYVWRWIVLRNNIPQEILKLDVSRHPHGSGSEPDVRGPSDGHFCEGPQCST